MIEDPIHISTAATLTPTTAKRFTLIGGPCDGAQVIYSATEQWPRYLAGHDATPVPDAQAQARLRGSTPDDGAGIYVRSVLPRGGGADSSSSYLHSSVHSDEQNLWHLVSHALTGSPAGRALGGGRDLPEAVLSGLLDASDGLIRLRLARERLNRRPTGRRRNPTTGELEMCWLLDDADPTAGNGLEGGDPQ